MAEHFTEILQRTLPIIDEKVLRAVCPEHGAIGNEQPATGHGFNAVVTEARGHDDVVHGVYRSDLQYREKMREIVRSGIPR